MASPTKSQTTKTKQEIHTLKNKLFELERQANEYKTKIDELRRAKATTTVVKLEKEYVNTILPGSIPSDKTKSCERCKDYQRMIDNEQKSNTQLKQIAEQKQQTTTTTTNKLSACSKCLDFKQLLDIEKQNSIQLTQQLHHQIKQTQQEQIAKQATLQSLDLFQEELIKTKNLSQILKKENEDYQNQFQLMKKEHQEKINDLIRREEDAKKQVATWEQMYREWMATMERRVHSLQLTNDQLQTWLKTEDNSKR